MLFLTFDPFGWGALASCAKAEALSLGELVSRACVYFHADLSSDRRAARVPSFARGPRGGGAELQLALPRETWRELAEEAVRQRLPLERLVEHAALYYVADVESGRAASRSPKGFDGGR